MNHHQYVHNCPCRTEPARQCTQTRIRHSDQSTTFLSGSTGTWHDIPTFLSSGGHRRPPALHCGVVGPVGRHVSLTIDAIPDDVLLEIFDYDRLLTLKSWNYRDPQSQTPWNWQRLVRRARVPRLAISHVQ